MTVTLSHIGKFLLSLGLLSPLLWFAHEQYRRPSEQENIQSLFQGIHYQHLTPTTPRPNHLHVVTIDLLAPGVKPFVTPALPNVRSGPDGDSIESLSPAPSDPTAATKTPLQAQTTREFVTAFELQLGVNANYFFEFRENTPWDFYPHTGDRVFVVGDAIAQGHRYGSPRSNWPAVCFMANRQARMAMEGACPDGTQHAVSGRDILVENGKALTDFSDRPNDRPYSRVAVGVDLPGTTMWLVVVDGKQPLYSEGLLLSEIALVFEDLGAAEAIALDGGGSSTLVVNTGAEPQLLNAPIHTKWPMRERPVANHLGFYALPINP